MTAPGEGVKPARNPGWLEICSDGASRGNPGPAGAGGQAKDENGRVLAEVSDFLGVATNNEAEYYALIRILEESAGLGYGKARLRLDSELVANQLTGGYRVKSRRLMPLLSRAKSLLAAFDEVEVTCVPREQNRDCDALANRAVDEWLAGNREPIIERDDSLFS